MKEKGYFREGKRGKASGFRHQASPISKLQSALIVLLISLSSALCPADPCYTGLTGLIWAPTASLYVPQEYSLGIYKVGEGGWFHFGYGFAGNWEGSLLGQDMPTGRKTLVNAKLNLFKEAAITPEISLGLMDLTKDVGTSFYTVLSKSLPVPKRLAERVSLRGHLGVGTGDSLNGVFGGVELRLSPREALIFEYANDHLNAGLRVSSPALPLRVHLSVVAGELGLGVSYNVKPD